jgi:2-polyprenyl-3-methyl-5-hydroxy-6-metoxy-1,4-benzoquinol methylase
MGVLEHIADPRSFLLEVRRRIHPGSEIMIGVPNAASLNRHVSRLSRHDWDMFLEPGHLYHYEISALTRLARQAGFRLRRWVSSTIAIRGKVPLLPARWVPLERTLQRAVASHAGVRWMYVTGLRTLDLFRVGDTLLATFGCEP